MNKVRSLHESYSQFCELFTLCEHLPKVAERAAVLKNQALDQGREGGSRLRAVSPVAAHADPKPPPLSKGVGTTCPLRTAVFSARRFGLSREHFDTLTDEIHLYLLLAGPGWAPDASPPVAEGIRH
jgi:hypothetical protein